MADAGGPGAHTWPPRSRGAPLAGRSPAASWTFLAARGVFGKSSEPLADSSDADGGKVADGEFVVSGRNGSVSFESVDAALHGVTLLVDLAVEGWRPATGRTTPEPMADLIARLADGRPDTASAQFSTVAARAVGLISQDPIRAGPGPAWTVPRYPDTGQDRAELRTVPGLPGSDQHRQRTLALLAGQMQFRAQPAP